MILKEWMLDYKLTVWRKNMPKDFKVLTWLNAYGTGRFLAGSHHVGMVQYHDGDSSPY